MDFFKKKSRFLLIVILGLIFLIGITLTCSCMFPGTSSGEASPIEVEYTFDELLTMVENGRVYSVTLIKESSSEIPKIRAVLKDESEVMVYIPSEEVFFEEISFFKQHEVFVFIEEPSTSLSFWGKYGFLIAIGIICGIPFLLLILLLLKNRRGFGGRTKPGTSGRGFGSGLGFNDPYTGFSKSKARRIGEKAKKSWSPWNKSEKKGTKEVEEKPPITFKDIGGAKEAKIELQEMVELLKQSEKFKKLGAKMPKGILLVGLPGTGKTLLARAVAYEAGVPFFSASGSEFMEMFVGVGPGRVRDLFEQARANAPSLVYIDEIDAIGRARGAGIGQVHEERENTLTEIFTQMDGIEEYGERVGVIASTNRPDTLDPALLRAGRFSRRVEISMPTLDEREEILEIHFRNGPKAPEVTMDKIAAETYGFSGADLMNLVNEAAILAARKDKEQIEWEDVEKAIGKVIVGSERDIKQTRKEKEIKAYHEGGHALVAKALPEIEPLQKVSIRPTTKGLGGFTQLRLKEDRRLSSRGYLLAQMRVLLAGRAAEELMFGETGITTGAQDDLQKAKGIARAMVCIFGMSELGLVPYGKPEGDVYLGKEITRTQDYSDAKAEEIDKIIDRMFEEAYREAREILEENKPKLIALAKKLIRKENLGRKELNKTLGRLKTKINCKLPS